MLRYTDNEGINKRAIIDVEFLTDEGNWVQVPIQIDTAADVSVIPYDMAHQLQFISMQMPVYVREVVGSVAAMQVMVKARIMGKEIELPIITSQYITEPLLGMASFVENFKFSFSPEGFEVQPI
mgnify:CR=1 FL=1